MASQGFTKESLLYYIDHPVEFAEDTILREINSKRPKSNQIFLDKQQKDFMNAVALYKRVGCKKGHGTGGSMSCALLILWFLITRPEPVRVPCTAPTHHQLADVLWPEVSYWLNQSNLVPHIEWTSEYIYFKGKRETMYAVCRTVAHGQSENLQGYHAEHLMFVVDEGFGIKDEAVWNVIEGALTSLGPGGTPFQDNKLVFLGQPSVVTGFCYNAFTRFKERWSPPFGQLITMNSEESHIVSKEWITNMRQQWPRTHDVYRVRVLGEFPLGNPESFIQLVDVEAARTREVKPSGILEMGLDVARFGDDLCVLTIRHGYHVFPQEILTKSRHTETAEMVVQTLRKYRAMTGYKGKVRVKVDETGGGEGVVDILHDNVAYKEDNFEVMPVDFRSKGFRNKDKGESFHDITSFMWGQLKEVINEIQLPDDQDLVDELAARRFKVEGGMIRIEPKADFKRDYKHSPDRSDSLILCFADYVAEKQVIGSYQKHEQSHVADFDIAWDRTNGRSSLHFGSLTMLEDGTARMNAAIWDDQVGHLYVYFEEHYDFINPAALAMDIKRNMKADNYCVEKLVGNDLMFTENKIERSVGMLTNRELKKITNNARLTQAIKFEQYGMIALLEQFFAEKRLTIHKDCEATLSELETWKVEAGKIDTEKRGYCRNILQIISALTRVRPEIAVLIRRPDYWRPMHYSVAQPKQEAKLGV